MRTCDVAVIGLGLMGSAALAALLNAGVNALGFDPIGLGDKRGSSHGSCRVFRRFNFENDNYTDLSDAALHGWKRLEAEAVKPSSFRPRFWRPAGPDRQWWLRRAPRQ
jgi:glycine/D-amino acid oxidase-like deaminating enzyme